MRVGMAVSRVALVLVVLGALLGGGCSTPFMRNRGYDLMDMFDGGFTTTEKPQLSVYLGFFNFITIGYADFDGTLHGICGREVGKFHAKHQGTGLLLWGHEALSYEGPPEATTLTEAASYAVGPLGLALGPTPPFRQTLNCPKLLHLGWVGVALNCHFPEFADFFLGWVGLDIFKDDVVGRAPAEPAASK